MTFQVRTEQRTVGGGRDGTVYVLESADGGQRAEVWPGLGFNCFRWLDGGDDLLFADPQLFESSRPTRSGIPVLFPFPNRVHHGRFPWNERAYQLPLNDSTGRHAIHGFVCQRPWRVTGHGTDDAGAWIEGQFHGARDAADLHGVWPADYRLTLRYRLSPGRLAVEAVVENPDDHPLPFGLGYHPYFRLPVKADDLDPSWTARVPAGEFWELDDNFPTGVRRPVDPARDLRSPRPVRDLTLDDVLTDVRPAETHPDVPGLGLLGEITRGSGRVFRVWGPAVFREVVAFTPPHRQALCLEPYTCPTDVFNLHARGLDAGPLVLPAGGTMTVTVLMECGRR